MDEALKQRVLAAGYPGDLRSIGMEDLREMRTDCETVESLLSFNRRLLQGRIDIVRDEIGVRAEGRTSSPADVVARLGSILADEPSTRPGGNRLVRMVTPDEAVEAEAAVDDVTGLSLVDLPVVDLGVLETALARLIQIEAVTSQERRLIHERLDAIQSEMARRYRDGEADVDTLLRGE